MDVGSFYTRVRACEGKAIAKAWDLDPAFLLSLNVLKHNEVNEFALARYAIRHKPQGITRLEALLAVTGILRQTE